jgi:hypothetical protein
MAMFWTGEQITEPPTPKDSHTVTLNRDVERAIWRAREIRMGMVAVIHNEARADAHAARSACR